jgi:putative oxidoreductase
VRLFFIFFMFKVSPALYQAKALFILRLVLAIVLVMHGYPKLFGGVDMFSGMLQMMGFPLPTLMATIVALLEFVGGLMILFGLFTRHVSALVAAQFVVILLFVKKFAFPASDLDLVILGVALALALLGAGAWSVDARFIEKKK